MGMKGWITEAEFNKLIEDKVLTKDFSFNKVVPCIMYSTEDNVYLKLPTGMLCRHMLVKEAGHNTKLFEAINDFTYEDICKEHCNKQNGAVIKSKNKHQQPKV